MRRSAALEHVMEEMNRFARDHTLEARIESGDVTEDDVAAVAERLALFHAGLPPVVPPGDPLCRAGCGALRTSVFGTLRDRRVRRSSRWWPPASASRARSYRLEVATSRAGRGPATSGGPRRPESRARAVGRRRGGRGLPGVRPGAATIDVSADLAFLLMDLERLGRRDLADALTRDCVAPQQEAIPAMRHCSPSTRRNAPGCARRSRCCRTGRVTPASCGARSPPRLARAGRFRW